MGDRVSYPVAGKINLAGQTREQYRVQAAFVIFLNLFHTLAMALITTQRLYAVVSHASQHRQQQQRNAQIAPQSAAVGDAVQIDMLGAVGVGKQIGDDPFGVERVCMSIPASRRSSLHCSCAG